MTRTIRLADCVRNTRALTLTVSNQNVAHYIICLLTRLVFAHVPVKHHSMEIILFGMQIPRVSEVLAMRHSWSAPASSGNPRKARQSLIIKRYWTTSRIGEKQPDL